MTRSPAGIHALRYAEALADAAAIVTRRLPAPRGLPFYGLDHPPGALDRMLAVLSDLGIFRVYSHVLDLGGGLGGPARWLARRHGCRVALVDSDPRLTAASALLTERAHLADRVSTTVARAMLLPFAPDTFTHVWGIESEEQPMKRPLALAEAWRVLRPGGWLALAERADGANADAPGAIEDELRSAGFREFTALELQTLTEDDSTAAHLVAERVALSLGVEAETETRAAECRPFVGFRVRKPA